MPVTSQRYEPDADLTALIDHPRNARRGADDSVSHSIDTNGWYGAIVAHEATGHILCGHTRRRVLVRNGTTTGPVLWVDCDDRTANRIVLADNRTAELAEWDKAGLLGFLQDIGEPDWAGAGFTPYDVEALARAIGDLEPVLTGERGDVAAGKPVTCPECGHEFVPGEE